jgi:hypothetical protein
MHLHKLIIVCSGKLHVTGLNFVVNHSINSDFLKCKLYKLKQTICRHLVSHIPETLNTKSFPTKYET